MNNIILLGAYWNEIEWIKASLAQIDKIDPLEIIISDGCFDLSYPNYSTDGTREIISDFVKARPHARMISALRLSLWTHYVKWFQRLPNENVSQFHLGKLRIAKSFHKKNLYRLNQMATFNYIVSISKKFEPGRWFMTYDSDQFYSDEMLKEFTEVVNSENSDYGLLTGKELTFFDDFNSVSYDYEKRDYNNMPHRIYSDTRFIPTRHPVRLINGTYKLYTEVEKKKFCGTIFHYHIKKKERMDQGYSLGNRKAANLNRCHVVPYRGDHPELIKRLWL